MRQTLLNLFLAFAIILTAQTAGAQTTTTDSISKAKADSVYKANFNQRGKSVYLESAGIGVVYSVNYDARFNQKQNGWGARAGVSYYQFIDEAPTLTVPVMVNYLFGKRANHFEVGAGATFVHRSGELTKDVFDINGNNNDYHNSNNEMFFATALGYRYQPLNGDFTFRAGANTIIGSYFWVPLWPYISVGYAFKNKAKANNK